MPNIYAAVPQWVADMYIQPGGFTLATSVLENLIAHSDSPQFACQYWQSLLDTLAVFDGTVATTAALPPIIPMSETDQPCAGSATFSLTSVVSTT
jgi:hypothetical protein